MRKATAPSLAWDSDPLKLLVGDVAKFMKQHWEREPAVFKATPERRALFTGQLDYAELLRLAGICEQEGQALEFGVDVNAARYIDGKRETPNGELADVATIERLYRQEGCTMQFHQPQRFSEELWRLLAALERQLGCLVGCNAYITPKGTQGLAPHYDDVEIWVVQTRGSKRWRLYRPGAVLADSAVPQPDAPLLACSHLANQPSGDLAEGSGLLGEAALDVVLHEGDVLYLPRGTVHQAAAQEQDSAHLTLSTYQRWSAADALQFAVSVALANPALQPRLPRALKAGLPLGFLAAAGMDAADAAALAVAAGGFAGVPGFPPAPAAAAGAGGAAGASSKVALAHQLAAACRSLASCLEDEQLGPRLVATAGEAMAEDFMRSRLPPHPAQLPERGPAPTLADSVQCVASGLFRLVPMNTTDEGGCEEGSCGSDCEEDHEHQHKHNHVRGPGCADGSCHAHGDDEDDEDEEGEGGAAGGQGSRAGPPAFVRLVSCLRNDRDSHMMPAAGGGGDDDDGGESSGSDSDSGSEDEEAEDSSEQEEGEEGEEEGPEDLVFPAEFAPALLQLLGSADDGGQPVAVRSLALPDAELQLQAALTLWDAGVLRTVKAAAALPRQQKGKQRPKPSAGDKSAQRPKKQCKA